MSKFYFNKIFYVKYSISKWYALIAVTPYKLLLLLYMTISILSILSFFLSKSQMSLLNHLVVFKRDTIALAIHPRCCRAPREWFSLQLHPSSQLTMEPSTDRKRWKAGERALVVEARREVVHPVDDLAVAPLPEERAAWWITSTNGHRLDALD